jgi:glucose-1-phosphate cytidylyltransferase
VTFDILRNKVEVHKNGCEPWRVTLVDTGDGTMTGGRLKRVMSYVGDETFFLTYGDGVSDINLDSLLAFHREEGRLATLTAAQPPGRFGAFSLRDGQTYVDRFREKPLGGGENAWINGGFFVLEPSVAEFIQGDETVWEREPLEHLAREHQLSAYRHNGFWHPMDTLRDRMILEELWESGNAPWNVWQGRHALNGRK